MIIKTIREIITMLALVYICFVLTVKLDTIKLSMLAFDMAIEVNSDVVDFEKRLRHWELYIDSKIIKMEAVQEYFDYIDSMEWQRFRNYQKGRKKIK